MKKLALFLSVLLISSLIGCSPNKTNTPVTSSPDNNLQTTVPGTQSEDRDSASQMTEQSTEKITTQITPTNSASNARVSPTKIPTMKPTAATSTPAPAKKVNNNTNLKLAPDFTLNDLNGKSVTLSSLKGKKVFVNFWATWCPPCVSELPEIEKISKENRSNLVVLTINSGDNDESTVRNFIAKNKYTFKVLFDTNGDASNKYNITTIPKSVFINTDGYVVDEKVGPMSLSEMESYLAKLN